MRVPAIKEDCGLDSSNCSATEERKEMSLNSQKVYAKNHWIYNVEGHVGWMGDLA